MASLTEVTNRSQGCYMTFYALGISVVFVNLFEKNPCKISLLFYWVVMAGFSSTNIAVLQ